MKKQKTVSIKAKLLGVIIPVVIAIVVVLVVAAYQISARDDQKIFPEFTAVFGREPGIPDRSMAE